MAGAPIARHSIPLAGALVEARIFHGRKRPKPHHFNYRAFYLCLDLADLPQLARGPLSLDRFNLLSFHAKDHGPRDGSDLRIWIDALLAQHGRSDLAGGRVVLQAHPRLLGYVFNPVSFWFCHDRQDRLGAVLCAVNNTFGERHLYLVAHGDGAPIEPDQWLAANKVFHVSPFLPVAGEYRFRFALAPDRVRADIHYIDGQGVNLVTYVEGRRRALTGRSAAGAFMRHPLMTLAVVARIHYQALRLWLKKAKFHKKPEPPRELLTR